MINAGPNPVPVQGLRTEASPMAVQKQSKTLPAQRVPSDPWIP